MRARMAIAVSGIQVELREVVLRNKPQALLDISPKATVPVLVTNDLSMMDESIDIMQWALQQSDPDNWLAQRDQDLIDNNDDPFKYWLDHYKYADRFPEQTEEFYRQQGEETLSRLEQHLVTTRYLSSDTISFTDIALFPFIRQFASVNLKWFEQSPYPKLRAWLNELVNSALFQSIMTKYPAWQEGAEITVFPPVEDNQ